MNDDLEAWLLEAGDDVIRKKSVSDHSSLAPLEQAIYALWVVDYAVRNSGTLGPMQELHPQALQELFAFSQSANLPALSVLLQSSANESHFCSTYSNQFGAACAELRQLHARA